MLSEPALPPATPAVEGESSAEPARAEAPADTSASSAAKKTTPKTHQPRRCSAVDVDRKLGFEVISTLNDRDVRPRTPACAAPPLWKGFGAAVRGTASPRPTLDAICMTSHKKYYVNLRGDYPALDTGSIKRYSFRHEYEDE